MFNTCVSILMKKVLFGLFFLCFMFVFSQETTQVTVAWTTNTEYIQGNLTVKLPAFDAVNYSVDITKKQIQFVKIIPVSTNATIQIVDVKYIDISIDELFDINTALLTDKIQSSIEIVQARNLYFGIIKFNPIIKVGNEYKKVVSFTYKIDNFTNNRLFEIRNIPFSISNSLLASGNWYRFYVEKSGVYKISKSFLQSLGFNTNIDPRTIKIYGNGGRMLPLDNSISYPEDLEENAIQFIGEEDGVFDADDYILFYAEGVDTWNEESLTSVNLFADKSYYYVTSLGSFGKRIQSAIQPSNVPDLTFNVYDDTIIYEKDLINPAKVGRRWFGEQFNIDANQTFNFSIPNLDISQTIHAKINFASSSFGNTSFNVKANSIDLGTVIFPQITTGSGIEGYESAFNAVFNVTSSNISIDVSYNNGGVPSSNGYLDFIKLNVKRNLTGHSKQFMFFNNEEQVNVGIGEYAISNASGIQQVWDITDIYNVTKYENTTGVNFNFKINLGNKKIYCN